MAEANSKKETRSLNAMKRDFGEVFHKPFDLLVIGGGIHGATLAWLAASGGIHTALIDKGDFGGATSANSQKIIHGGLRYIQHFDLPRIMQSINARNTMLRIAPHLIDPLPCVMPTVGYGFKGREALATAMTIYNCLSVNRNRGLSAEKRIPRCRLVSTPDMERMIPGLVIDNMRGGALWYDAICTNTERLLISFIQAAHNAGASLANYVQAKRIRQSGNETALVACEDKISGSQLDIEAKKVAFCCGPWAKDNLSSKAVTRHSGEIELALGMNIITNRIFEHKTAVGLPSNQSGRSRLFFVVPWKGKSIIGTDWSWYRKHPDDLTTSEQQCAKFLADFNRAYPPASLSLNDVLHVHTGLVPCSLGKAAGEITVQPWQHARIWDHGEPARRNVITVIGVKYTTAINVAERVIAYLFPGRRKETFHPRPLSSARPSQVAALANRLKARWSSIAGERELARLVVNYGLEAEKILDLSIQGAADDAGQQKGVADLLWGETAYAIENEMAQTLSDIVIRRMDLGENGCPSDGVLKRTAACAARFLGWGPERIQREIEQVKQQYRKVEPTNTTGNAHGI